MDASERSWLDLFLSSCKDLPYTLCYVRDSPSVISGPAASTMCENLLEMQILRSQLRCIEWETLGGGAQQSRLASP